MKKKLTLGSLAMVLIAVAVFGTVAYFSKSFTSTGNTAQAAKFNVDTVNAQGQTIGDGQFALGGKLQPGMDPVEVYQFQIKKNDTEVPLEYNVDLIPSGDLFPSDGSSPIKLKMERKVAGAWEEVNHGTAFRPESDSEDFRIFASWPHGNNDIAFQGKTGNIKLEVIATQVDEEEKGPFYTGKVTFKATPNGSAKSTTNKGVVFNKNADGLKVIDVTMGDGNGDFERTVGNFKITESVSGGETWYRVVTASEYYASDKTVWRLTEDRVDTSKKGTIHFNKGNNTYLTIESEALYNWFVKK
ncbi:hypothetical protein [Cytobacillus purgationiresistens]|uniref:Uncharacterized protein n=1 Tax=Cytobacillus purgationiresistens TaxID=863449 RepID=A0ABU0AMK1_9BACI|nr:hypothetical protein [Cytobacillus purgationiresistens]MDQ0272489.1 hypothetical protein [Cytobacillus purgationiresistens]